MTTPNAPRPVEPRHHSPRRPGTGSNGPRVARLSAGLHRPFLPWQRAAADLICEVDPASGLLTRSLVVMTVQRQAGKTEVVKALITDRCLFHGPARRVWYTAQTGQYARDKWAELVAELSAKGSPLAGMVAARWAKGDECLTFPNGSTFRPFPPTRDALHSKQSDLVVIDEAWKHDPVRGAEIMQAVSPTQATRPGAQTVILSTMGTAASTWWHTWVDRGRAGDPAVDAYIEYGIGDDGDPDDLPAVIAAHPGVPDLTSPAFIHREHAKLDRNEFARAYGNARTIADSRFIDLGDWSAARSPAATLEGAPVFAFGAADDRSRAAIVSAAGRVCEVVDTRPGVDWVPARMVELIGRWSPASTLVAAGSPAEPLADRVRLAGAAVTSVSTRDYATACVQLVDALTARSVRIRPHPDLDRAADAAVPRPVGDGMWAWGRRLSGAAICEVDALTLALWGDAHRPAPAVRPVVVSA